MCCRAKLFRVLLLLCLLVASLFACYMTSWDRDCVFQYTQRNEAVLLWKSHPSHSYQMLLESGGGMTSIIPRRYLITVRHDQEDEILRWEQDPGSRLVSDGRWITLMAGGVWQPGSDSNWGRPFNMGDLFSFAVAMQGTFEFDLQKGIITYMNDGFFPCTHSVASDAGYVRVLEFEFLPDDDSG